jgi:hypothetical protein
LARGFDKVNHRSDHLHIGFPFALRSIKLFVKPASKEIGYIAPSLGCGLEVSLAFCGPSLAFYEKVAYCFWSLALFTPLGIGCVNLVESAVETAFIRT